MLHHTSQLQPHLRSGGWQLLDALTSGSLPREKPRTWRAEGTSHLPVKPSIDHSIQLVGITSQSFFSTKKCVVSFINLLNGNFAPRLLLYFSSPHGLCSSANINQTVTVTMDYDNYDAVLHYLWSRVSSCFFYFLFNVLQLALDPGGCMV